MTQESIFTPSDQEGEAKQSQEAPIVATEAPAAPPAPSIPPELADYVGEGKKYKSVEDVYKAFPNAQQKIATLESEISTYKEELAKRKAAEELLEDIRNGIKQPEATTSGVEVNQEVISKLVKQQLDSITEQERRKANASTVSNVFIEAYGEKAREMAAKVAGDNGMSIQEYEALALKSPQAAINLAGLKKGNTGVAPLKSDVNTQASFSSQQPQVSSARVGPGANSKDLARAWAATREKVYKDLNIKG